MSVYRVGSNKSSINNFPNVRPSLDLDFANTKTLDPRITFTRSSGGSYVGADGLIKYAGVNEPRFDHNPTTGESLGLLVEEARTNLLTYSSTLSSPWYFPYLTRVANAGVAPDGTNTASSFATTAVGGYKFLQPVAPTLLTSTNYCFSLYVKLLSGTGTASSISIGSNSNLVTPNYASYGLRLDNVTETTTGTVPSIKGYTALPNGWFRIYMVFNTAAQTNAAITIYVGDLTTNVASFLIWGAQLEAGSFPTSYIPTQASAVTRAADVAKITGTNFSSWYRQDEGTMYAFFKGGREPLGSVGRVVSPGGINVMLSSNGSKDSLAVWFGGPLLALNSINNVDYWNVGDSAVVAYNSSSTIVTKANQSSSFSQTPNRLGTITAWTLGSNSVSSTNMLNGTISHLTYWPKRLPNAQLQALTR